MNGGDSRRTTLQIRAGVALAVLGMAIGAGHGGGRRKNRKDHRTPAFAGAGTVQDTMAERGRGVNNLEQLLKLSADVSPVSEAASSRLQSKILSKLVELEQAEGPLCVLSANRAQGDALCVFEHFVAALPSAPTATRRPSLFREAHAPTPDLPTGTAAPHLFAA